MAMMKCAECSKEVSSKAKSCPNCGVDVKKPASPLKVIGFIAFGMLVVSIVKAVVSPDHSATRSTESYAASASTASSSSALTANGEKFKRGQYGNLVYTGNIINTTGKKLSYVQVEINLYDKNNVQVGSTLANINNLEPGVTWSFEAPVMEARAKTGKVAGITTF
jgi:hypothetical protein